MQAEAGPRLGGRARPGGPEPAREHDVIRDFPVAAPLRGEAAVCEIRARDARGVLEIHPQDVPVRGREQRVALVPGEGQRQRRQPVRLAQDLDVAIRARDQADTEEQVLRGVELGQLGTVGEGEGRARVQPPADADVAAERGPHEHLGQAAALDEDPRVERVEGAEKPGLDEVGRQRACDLAVGAVARVPARERAQLLGEHVGHVAAHLEPARAAEEVAAGPARLRVGALRRADAGADADAVRVPFVDLHDDGHDAVRLVVQHRADLRMAQDVQGEEVALAAQQLVAAVQVPRRDGEHAPDHGGGHLLGAAHLDLAEARERARVDLVQDAGFAHGVGADVGRPEDLGARVAAVHQPVDQRIARGLEVEQAEGLTHPQRQVAERVGRQDLVRAGDLE